jgi:hypothetical protein
MPAWDTTFHWLKMTGNRAAGELLVRAMETFSPEIGKAAIFTLMARREVAGHQLILERIDPASEEWRGQLKSLPFPFLDYLRSVLIRGEPHVRAKACHFLVETEQFEFVPFLINVLEHRECEPRSVVIDTILELSRRLRQHLEESDNRSEANHYGRVAEQLRRALLIAADRFPKHECREVLDAFLLLAEGHSGLLAGIVTNRGHPARRTLLDILFRETGTHALAVLCHFLYQTNPPEDILSIISRRSDLPFLRHFFAAVGSQPDPVVRRNLKRFHTFRWLKEVPQLLPQLDDIQQQAIPVIVTHSRISRDEALKVIGHVLLEGQPAGRRSAAEALSEFHGTEANALTIRAMQDHDPSVQAVIIPQLRHRGILGALPYIVSRLDSPHPIVRRAARKSLREFSFTRFLQAWDLLPPEVRKNTGMLVKRVDPRTTLLLRAELLSPFRLRRLRALEVAMELELVSRLESSIIGLLQDEDSLVRAEAASALSQSDSVASYQALLAASDDVSATVRNAVARSLEERQHRMELKKQSQEPPEQSRLEKPTSPLVVTDTANRHDLGQHSSF